MSETKIDTGGLAHPQEHSLYGCYKDQNGITRRDECADRIAASIAGERAANKTKLFNAEEVDLIVVFSYKLSDALIAEGRKGEWGE